MHLLLTAFLIGNPYTVQPANPYSVQVVQPQAAPEWCILWPDGSWCKESNIGKLNDFSGRVSICEPNANGRLTVHATLQDATRQQIQTALAAAKAERRVAKEVSRMARPFAEHPPRNADGSSKLPVGSVEALDELNELRTRRGLKPYIRDDGLTIAAARAATKRADRLLFGHLEDEFSCVPEGSQADAAGCAAYANTGWLSCCMWESARFAGAAFVVGRDGKRYMHLFIRH